ncbi:hypothetical protein MALU111345_10710 [Marinicrinis lubricantis]
MDSRKKQLLVAGGTSIVIFTGATLIQLIILIANYGELKQNNGLFFPVSMLVIFGLCSILSILRLLHWLNKYEKSKENNHDK